MAREKSKELATVKTGDVSAFEYGQDLGTGFENQSQEDYKIPFLSVLQALSPQVKPVNKGGIAGAQEGMIHLTGDEIFKGETGLVVIPAMTDHCYMEWVPREKGGGFVARHEIHSPIVQECKQTQKFGEYKTKAGNNLNETFYVYAIIEQDRSPVIIPFTSTKIDVYKTLMLKLRKHMITLKDGRKINPPLFANRLRICTIEQTNPKGVFYNFKITPAEEDTIDPKTGEILTSGLVNSLLPPDSDLIKEAIEFNKVVKEGKAKVDFNVQSSTSGSEDKEESSHF